MVELAKKNIQVPSITNFFYIDSFCNFLRFVLFHNISINKTHDLGFGAWFSNLWGSCLYSLMNASRFLTLLLNLFSKYYSALTFAFFPVLILSKDLCSNFHQMDLWIQLLSPCVLTKLCISFFKDSLVYLCPDEDSNIPYISKKLFANSDFIEFATAHLFNAVDTFAFFIIPLSHWLSTPMSY